MAKCTVEGAVPDQVVREIPGGDAAEPAHPAIESGAVFTGGSHVREERRQIVSGPAAVVVARANSRREATDWSEMSVGTRDYGIRPKTRGQDPVDLRRIQPCP